MSNHQTQVYIENLIEEYNRLKDLWNGSDLGIERKMDDIAGELADLGVNIDCSTETLGGKYVPMAW